jgi:hypothetical protein
MLSESCIQFKLYMYLELSQQHYRELSPFGYNDLFLCENKSLFQRNVHLRLQQYSTDSSWIKYSILQLFT